MRQRITALDPDPGAERWCFDPWVKPELAGASKWTFNAEVSGLGRRALPQTALSCPTIIW